MRKIKWMAGSCFALALGLLALGCSGNAAGKAAPFSTPKGAHPSNWIEVHYSGLATTPDQCRSCHGSLSDPAQAGGISKVSCFKCHSAALPHVAGWADHVQHGRQGAQLAPSADPMAMTGLAHCTKCHGTDYSGGLTAISCTSCHTKAPHPSKPWRGTPATQSSHAATNVDNAPACFKCHAAGANSTVKPLTVPAAGTAPGCYNDTMCHAKQF